MNQKFSKQYVVSVDGSRFSDYAVEVAKSLLKKHDHIKIFHVYSSADSGQADPERLRNKYEVDLIGRYPSSQYSFLWHNNDNDDRPIKKIMMSVADGSFGGVDPDIMVIGYSGWRFHQTDSRRSGHATTLGSTADFAMRNIHLPIVLVKQAPRDVEGKHFVMAVNRSNASKTGLDILYTMLTPADRLTVINVYDDSMDAMGNTDYQSVKNYYMEDLRENCPTTFCKFEPVMKNGATSTVRTVCDYVEELEEEVDFFVIAPRARADKSFSSFTEKAIMEMKCNIILCKV